MISTRSVGLVIDTVVCLTLAKWETVSGQFGGYLKEQTSKQEGVTSAFGPISDMIAASRLSGNYATDCYRSGGLPFYR